MKGYFCDNENSAAQSALCANQLINTDHVIAVMATYGLSRRG